MICGDHAWPGLSLQVTGRPCTIGHPTMLTPNLTMTINHTHTADQDQWKCALHEFTKDSDTDAQFWNPLLVRIALIFAPGVAKAKALTTL